MLIVPALSLLTGIAFREAVAVSLVAVAAMSVSASPVFLRQGLVDIPIAIEFQFFSVFGAAAAGLMAPVIPETPLYFLFAVVLLYSCVRMLKPPVAADANKRPEAPRRLGNAAALGSGALSGLLGVGGGVLNTPVLHLIFGLPFRVAAGTSIFILGATAASAALIYLFRGDVILGAAALTAVGAGIGAGLMAAVGHRTEKRWLRTAFAVFLTVVALVMVRNGFGQLLQ